MCKSQHLKKGIATLIACILSGALLYGQGQGLVADWSFPRNEGSAPRDSVHGVKARIHGYYKYVPGVSGDALMFDGYTTSMTVPAEEAPSVGKNGLTVEAWVALNTYPWNWVPVVDQEEARREGYFFGIDAFGHIGLQASIDGRWYSLTSEATLPLKKWVHITGTYEATGRRSLMKIYIDGKMAGQLALQGELTPAHTDMLIGRVRQATIPFPEALIHLFPVWYSLDGILDGLEIYDRSLSPAQVAKAYAAVKAPAGDVLPWPKLPSGPPGEGRFGAYYTTLHYQNSWDRLRRIGPDSDVVVRFDEAPIRLVFWQGASYVPAWVTENGKWYTDEWLETGFHHNGIYHLDSEPISDKQDRYSRVKILESNNARVVIEWRYALNEAEHYWIAWPDPYTGWGDWADEFWTIYPDGVAVRKQILYSSNLNAWHEWQETIVINQPGSRPDDDINWNALTLENMQGQTKTYTWRPKPAGSFALPNGPAKVTGPPDPNIQLVNMKSKWKPFQIVPPKGASADIYTGANTYFNFECWNHWPVAQIASSGRPCVADDRPSHSSLSHLHWKAYARNGDSETKILMDGLTTKSPAQLIMLARSWLSPPKMEVHSDGYRNDGYDPTQRAYVLRWAGDGTPATLRLTFDASDASPIFDPAIVIKNWGESGAKLKIDGKPVAWGKSFREGYVHRLRGTDLVVWIQVRSTQSIHVELAP